MENLRLLLVITVLCAVLNNGLAQNRGSSRYSPAEEEFDGEGTLSQRSPPTRRSSVRRRKLTTTPEPIEINKDLSDYQLPNREGTTARRVPSRAPVEEFTPHVPDVPVLSDEPIQPLVTDELPQTTTTAPEDKSQGRRRRPKKRRRPQNGAAKPTANAEKLEVTEPEKSSVPIPVPELLDVDQKRPEPFSVNPELISNPNKFDSTADLAEKPLWNDDKLVNTAADEGRRNPEPAPYYPPQFGTNRLPLEDTEGIESTRGHPEPSPPALNREIPSRRYIPPRSTEKPPSRASYVPVLTPIRVPTESRSRMPQQDFSEIRNQESIRRSRPSERYSPQRTSVNRTPSIAIPEVGEDKKITRDRAPHSYIPQNNQPRIPERALPEVRLPPTEQPILANEFTDKPGFETAEELLERLEEEGNPAVEGIDLQNPDAASRLPDPGDVPYDAAYPSYTENIGSEERSAEPLSNRREEVPSEPRASFNDIQPQEPPKRQSNNNVDTDGRQISRYEPPLQRGGLGSRGSDRSQIVRGTAEDNSPARGRGSSRYQPEAAPKDFSRTRSASRSSSESSSNTPERTRNSQAPSQTSTLSRNTQRYHPDPAESRSRVSTRRQPVDEEYTEKRPDDSVYRHRAPAPSYEEQPQYIPPPRRNNSPVNVPDEEYTPARRAVQSRPPQNEAPDAAEPYREELSEEQPNPNAYASEYQGPRRPSQDQPDPNAYAPEYQGPRQPNQDQPDANAYSTEYQGPRRPSQDRPDPNAYAPEYHGPRQPSQDRPDPNAYAPEYQGPRQPSRIHPADQRGPPAPDAAEPYIREELPEDRPDPNAYAPEYQDPRQPSKDDQPDPNAYQAPRQPSRTRPVDQRGPPLREQSVSQRGPSLREQSERQVSRQTSRRENVGHRNTARQPQHDHRSPEENTRYQPEYQAPQNSRNQARPAPQRDPYQGRQPAPRQQPRGRQPEPTPNQGRTSGSSKFRCPDAFGFFADPVQCDKYYECRNGTAVENLCEDGLAFNEGAAPKFLRCDSLRDVDCSSRPELQKAQPTKNCARRYGLYPDETDCTKFWNCVAGAATEVKCPPGLIFNDERATCDWADLVKSSCKTEDLLGFTCPEASAHDLKDGVYITYPHPDNCQLHFVCIKGEDGLRRPRMLTCHEGLVYNPANKACSRPDGVPGCEDFYGSRSPPKPQRKPAREAIEPEEYEEEPPTPKPRRRVQHRRQRN